MCPSLVKSRFVGKMPQQRFKLKLERHANHQLQKSRIYFPLRYTLEHLTRQTARISHIFRLLCSVLIGFSRSFKTSIEYTHLYSIQTANLDHFALHTNNTFRNPNFSNAFVTLLGQHPNSFFCTADLFMNHFAIMTIHI